MTFHCFFTAFRYRLASPAALLPLGVPQLLVNGTNDLDVPLATVIGYAAKARLAGDSVEELVFETDGFLGAVPDRECLCCVHVLVCVCLCVRPLRVHTDQRWKRFCEVSVRMFQATDYFRLLLPQTLR